MRTQQALRNDGHSASRTLRRSLAVAAVATCWTTLGARAALVATADIGGDGVGEVSLSGGATLENGVLNFPNQGDFARINGVPGFNGTDDWTIVFWANHGAAPDRDMVGFDVTDKMNVRIDVWDQGVGTRFRLDAQGGDRFPTTNVIDLTTGADFHYAVVNDAASGELRLYTNGTLIEAFATSSWNLNAAGSMYLGDNPGQKNGMIGTISGFGLYDEVLPEAALQGLQVGQRPNENPDDVIRFFSATPSIIAPGGSAVLRWGIASDATAATIEPGAIDALALTDDDGNGSVEVDPATDTEYALTVDTPAEAGITEDAMVGVSLIGDFSSDESVISTGGSATLSWTVRTDATVSITPDPGLLNTVDGKGSIAVTPSETTTYTLIASAGGTEETAEVRVSVVSGGEGPVAYWPFDEADGTVAVDVTGNGNDGALIGDALFDPAGGLFGGAVSLDGDGDLVEVPDAESLEFPQGQDFSITLFYNSGGVTSDTNNGLVTKGYGDDPRSPDGYYLLQVTNPSQFEFDSRCCPGGTPRVRSGQVGPSITDGSWHNVTLVRDYAAGEIRSYIDGNLEHTITMGDNTEGDWNMGVNSESLQIGDHLNRFTTGLFDDVALWRRALTTEEIAAIAAEGVGTQLGSGGPFQITEITYSPEPNAEVTFSWPSRPGQTFVIERGTALEPAGAIGGWEELDDSFPAAEGGEATTYVDDALGGAVRLFYRVTRN